MRNMLSGDIAVIGMACRFPGARNPDQYWDNLAAGRISVTEAPAARWRWQDYVGDSESRESNWYCRWGGFIDDVDAFDAPLFNVSAREAESMDPQQRLGLELAWSCFEDAGIRPSRLSGGNVGVFLGFTNLDYKEIMELSPIDVYYATGTLSSVIPNRISYQFNLRGPSVAVDTACSSSLNAIHLACRALQANECEAALTGGISLLLTPKRFIWYGKAGILSSTGTLRTFDEEADGTVRGEGAGLILLKPLARAIADGNKVIGVIKGSAVNHGGKSHTLTYPSASAQAGVIVSALQAAGVSPSAVSYVEAHGTGTIKGDPIEVQGLVQAFQSGSGGVESGHRPWCGLGSVKPNIGHLEGAAGIAGVIKVLQALRHKTIPPLVNFTNVNSRIHLGDAFYFADKLQKWESHSRPRIAGVSSFGFAGTNAHVVVAEAPVTGQDVSIPSTSRCPSVVVLSARDSVQLREQATELGQAIAAQGLSDSDLDAVAYTLHVGREAMKHRVAMTVRSMKELEAKLDQFVESKSGIEGLCLGEVKGEIETPAFGRDEELQLEAAGKWRQGAEWSKLAEPWVKGMEIDWERLYGEPKPRLLSLPTYPFARQRYWISKSSETIPDNTGNARLHPLVHQNTSDLSEQRFSSVFTGQEFFLADHQIQGRRVLPAAAYLEMVREAVTRATARPDGDGELRFRPIEVKNLVWLRPLVVGTEPVKVHIGLFPNERGEINFEVYSGSSAEEVVHAHGVAVTGAMVEAPSLNVEALAKRYDRDNYPSEVCYAAFEELGIEYRDGHCGIEGLHVEEDEVVARLLLPVSRSGDHFVLHPGAIDSGLQAIIGFALAAGMAKGSRPFLPFDLQSAELYGPSAPQMWAVVRRDAAASGGSMGRYDIDFCDEAGHVFVRLNGLTTRAIESKRGAFAQSPADTGWAKHSERTEPGASAKGGRASHKRRLRFSSAMREVAPQDSAFSPAIIGMGAMWARLRQEKGKYDIDLSDEYGRVSVHFRDWTAPPPQGEPQGLLSLEPSGVGEVILTPVWESIPHERAAPHPVLTSGRMVVIGGTNAQRLAIQRLYADAKYVEVHPDDTADSICAKIVGIGEIEHLVWILSPQLDVLAAESVIAEQSRGVFLGFRLIKAMLAAGYGDRALTWTILTTGVEAVEVNEPVHPTHASVHGLMGSAANEYAAWTVRVIDLPPSGEWPWNDVFTVQGALRGNTLVYREGQWYRKHLLPYRLLDEPPLMGGAEEVYVMIGGHGGIGAAWSEVLLRRTRVQLVWIGRRPIDKILQSRINQLAEIGPEPLYISADATDRQQLEHARSMILQRFGRIDGLVHAAMVLRDQSLANMTEDAFNEALRSKVDVCVRLAQVFGQDALRFVLFFSSWNAFIKSAGQSNYVAGCTFEDSFARRMASEWPCRVRVINWGYWGTVGAATSERYQSLMARKGLGSIKLQGASRILDELLCGNVVQMTYLEASGRGALQACHVRSDEWTTSFQEVLPSCLTATAGDATDAAAESASPDWCVAVQELDAILTDLLWLQLHSSELFPEKGTGRDVAQTSAEVRTRFGQWLKHTIHLLEARGYLVRSEGKLDVSDSAPIRGAVAWEQWERRKGQWLEDREWAQSAQLVEAALRALPDILTGRRTAAEILLANSSADSSAIGIAKMLRTGPIAQFCRETIARAVVRYLEQRRQIDPRCKLRILEVSVGTSGANELVSEAISPYGDFLKEYACAGVSLPTLPDGRSVLDSDPAYVTYRTFEVDRAPEAQGIALDCYDLVIASNVLHSAKDVRKALRNVKAVLKTNGLLMIHDLAANTILNHLTAGLLDAWWMFADTELRIPGGPALMPGTWETILRQEGFRSMLFPAGKAHGYGHLVVVAESNGVIRQGLSRPALLEHPGDKLEAEQEYTSETRAAAADRSATIDEIMGGPRSVAIEHLLSKVRLHTAEALGVDAATLEVPPRPFADMLLAEVGMDSLSSSDLRIGLRQDFGIDIPVQRILAEKVHSLVDALYNELLIRRVSQAGEVDSDDRETYVF
jgi:polyketide synthase PksJ